MPKTKKDETTTNTAFDVIEFRSNYKNLTIAGTKIVFINGVYKTSNLEEIELLKSSNLVSEVGE